MKTTHESLGFIEPHSNKPKQLCKPAWGQVLYRNYNSMDVLKLIYNRYTGWSTSKRWLYLHLSSRYVMSLNMGADLYKSNHPKKLSHWPVRKVLFAWDKKHLTTYRSILRIWILITYFIEGNQILNNVSSNILLGTPKWYPIVYPQAVILLKHKLGCLNWLILIHLFNRRIKEKSSIVCGLRLVFEPN